MRSNAGGTLRPQARTRCQPLRRWVPQGGTRWQGWGTACVSRPWRVDCTLRAGWEAGDKEAGFILTELPPEASEAGWSGLRAWIAPGCKIPKRGGWPWQRPRRTDPERAARLGLAGAVATVGVLRVGGEAEEAIPPRTLRDSTGFLVQRHRPRRATRLRLVRVCRRGWIPLMVARLNHRRLPTGRFVPEPWPEAKNGEAKLEVNHEVPLAA